MKGKTSALMAVMGLLGGIGKKQPAVDASKWRGSQRDSWLRRMTDLVVSQRRRQHGPLGSGWLVAQQPSYHLQRSERGHPIPVHRARYEPTSRYNPRTARKERECARRRRQLRLGEFEPGRVAA